jgi:hypothetical protein
LATFERIIGLELDDVTVDRSQHKAPCGGEEMGPHPSDGAKLGWKWSVATERHGIRLGWAIDGANRHDEDCEAPWDPRRLWPTQSWSNLFRAWGGRDDQRARRRRDRPDPPRRQRHRRLRGVLTTVFTEARRAL